MLLKVFINIRCAKRIKEWTPKWYRKVMENGDGEKKFSSNLD